MGLLDEIMQEAKDDVLQEEWDKTPESAKQLIRDTVFIDHINDDPYDNRVENLRWVTPLQNSNYRKQREKMTAKTKNKNKNTAKTNKNQNRAKTKRDLSQRSNP